MKYIKTTWNILFKNPVITAIFSITSIFFLFAWIFGWSSAELQIDKVVHAILPATGALLLYATLVKSHILPRVSNQFGIILMIILLGCFIETVWEIGEFTAEPLFNADIQHGNFDTMMDIVMAFIGSAIAGLWYAANPKQLKIE